MEKGSKHTERTKVKMSESHKGQKKGQTYEQVYGVEKAKKIKMKMRKARLGVKIPIEKRWKLTDENKRNQSLAKLGHITSLKGKTYEEIYGVVKAEMMKKKRKEEFKYKEKYMRGMHCKPHTKETRAKISKAGKGRCHSKKTREKIGKGNKGKVVSEKTKMQISETRAKRIAEGKIKYPTHGKNGYFYSEKNKKKLWYRSSYELQAYEILEQLSKVVKYEPEPFYIPYKFQGLIKNYIPDILVIYDDSSQELIEVMRENLLDDERRVAKIKSAKEYCKSNNMIFSVWTEKELFCEKN